MVKHNDMLGNVINVDDIVICYATINGGSHPSFPRHGLVIGKVIKLSPRTVLVKCIKITGKEKDEIRIGNFEHITIINEQMLASLMKKRLEVL